MMINIQMNPNNILALPLKLPKFEPDDWDVFWEVWERDKRLYNRNYADTAGNDSLIPGWIGFSWNFNNGYNLGMFDILDKDYSDVFPKFHKQLIESLPVKIHYIMFQSNVREIPTHQDGAPTTDHLPYPASIRILLSDKNEKSTFFFINKNKREGKFLKLPEDTNSFVYNNPKIHHGAHYHNKEKILMHVVCDSIDEDKWFKLLDNSYREYKDIFSMIE